ncbi:MAG: hypothetical protein EOP32_03655 [Rhodococcus sp. (in: high G+C Gram-positive bacteria)]|nr:MAG: hypothetical protein EOP32_03655 [Rhodococcus sp. (in: high G+C Gram-positive bacteria)]
MEAPPPRLPLVGRTEDVAAICALFGDPAVGMLTVVGQAGVGKTTVVAAVAERLTASGIDVSWVDLSECASGRDGLAMIEAACARSSASEIARVIVVDSLERIGAEVRAIGAMAVAHPNVALLATSRAATGLFREYRYRLDPLPCPPLEGPVPADGGRGSALQLFLDHARRVAFETDLESNTPTVAAICRRLDGSPLALLIAANQLSTVTLEGLRGRLESGGSPSMRGPSDLPDRHHTLARTLADSVTLLAPDDAELIQVLALFDGVIEPAAVVEVLTEAAEIEGACGDTFTPDTVVEHLGELVHHTLLHPVHERSSGKSITFAMTHIVRDYGRHLLHADPRQSGLRAAHAEYFRRRVVEGADLVGPDADTWLSRTDGDFADIRSALRFYLGIGDARALAVAAGMRNYWLARGLLQEGVEWLTDSIATASDHRTVAMVRALEARAVLTGAASSYASVLDDLSECVDRWEELGEPVARARTMVDLAAAQYEVNGFELARPLFEEAIATLDAARDLWWAARARSLFGASAATTGNHRDLARTNLDHAVEGFRNIGDSSYTNLPLQQLGRILHEDGHDVQAVALLTEGLRLARGAGDAWNTSVFLNLLADIALARGNSPAAASNYLDSLALAAEIGAKPRFIWCLEGLAVSLNDLGESSYAARLVGLALSIRSTLNLHGWVEFPARAIDVTAIPTGSSSNLAVLHAQGFGMTVGDVLAYAPQLVEANTRSDSRRGRRGRFPDGLTVREVQVLRLIAGGSTSRAIATELVISIETVGRHISNLYRKIGASGRAEATAYAIRSGLMED